ncbi:hypothetical protein LZ554_003261 [Drepanopeziza brunnea f. sp. 'monogermtubi']|nr:hypothetical protein LZ554_003261 [Drepanopeziza brunnea f. sp. 'monogermtubi']
MEHPAVRDLMGVCNCSEENAIRLLKLCNNSVDEAQLRYDIETLYGVPTGQSKTQELQSPPDFDFDCLSYDSSDEDSTLVPPAAKDCLPIGRPEEAKKLQDLESPDDIDESQRPLTDVSGESLPSVDTKVVEPIYESSPLPEAEPSTWEVANPINPKRSTQSPVVSESGMEASVPQRSVEIGSNSWADQSHVLRGQVEALKMAAENTAADHSSSTENFQRNQPSEEETLSRMIPEPEWDFKLPEIPAPPTLTPGAGDGNDGFSLHDLVGAIQHGVDIRLVTEYLAYYDSSVVRKHLGDTLRGLPSIFFAVGTNDESLIRLRVEFGADVSAVHESSGVPLLAFAIMNSEEILESDTTLAVSTLLSLGAAPEVIPSPFYSPFTQDLPDSGPSDESLKSAMELDTNAWCTPAARAKLARTANITQRYYLERASKAKKPSSRHRQVVKLRNAEALLGIPYFLIGQTIATNRLFQKLLTYMMGQTKRPLVMVFAGPSGHGKTELARRLGHLMSLDLEIVDCTIHNREMDLFGPRDPYVGAEHGSPLNNFLVKNAGKRCIVFLDEFEKTTTNVHQALLVPFDNVWILATNALDPTIQRFCKLHRRPIFEDEDESEKHRLMKTLSKALKEDFLSQFGPPVTGRISEFIPFLPFSPGEQAVIVHKFLLELAAKVRGPVNLVSGPQEQLLGNVRMKIRRDASVCRLLAEAEYHSDLGARSLITGAGKLEDALVEAYLEVDEEICEGGTMVDFVVDVNGSEVIARMAQ